MSQQIFIYIYSRSPLLSLAHELGLLSDQRQHNKCNVLELSQNHPHSPVEKLSSRKPGHFPGTQKVGDQWSRLPQESHFGTHRSWPFPLVSY